MFSTISLTISGNNSSGISWPTPSIIIRFESAIPSATAIPWSKGKIASSVP